MNKPLTYEEFCVKLKADEIETENGNCPAELNP